MMIEDSLDGGPPSVGSGEIPTPITASIIATPTPGVTTTPVSSKKQVLTITYSLIECHNTKQNRDLLSRYICFNFIYSLSFF